MTLPNIVTPQIAFSCGLAVQAVIKVFSAKDKTGMWKKLLSALLISLFLTVRLYFGKHYHGPFIWENFLTLYVILLTGSLCILFRREILSEINELVLLVWNIGLFYLTFTLFGFKPIILIPLALSLLAFGIALFNVNLSRRTQIGMYIWFMLLGIYTSIAFLPWREISQQRSFAHLGVLHLFFLGQMLFYSFSYLVYLLYFIPMTDKRGKSVNDTKEHAKIIEEKFDETQFHPYATVLVLFVVVFLFSVNYNFGFVDDKILLAIVFGLSPFLGEKYHAFLKRKQTLL